MSNDGSMQVSHGLPADPSPSTRELWVDVARGGAILLVILHHAWQTLSERVEVAQIWTLVDQSLTSMRMPTFFMISGLFAARTVAGPFARVWRGKLLFFGYLYLIWSAFYVVFSAATAALGGDSPSAEAWEAIVQTLTLNGPIWYLPALATFLGLAFVLRRLPPSVQLLVGLTSLVPFALRFVESGSWGVDRMAQYFFWFLVGCHASAWIRRTAARATWMIAVALLLIWGAAGVVLLKTVGRGWHAGDLLLPFLAVPMAAAVAVVLGRTLFGGPLAALGRDTLPVYVLHDAMIVLALAVLPESGALGPLSVTVVAATGCVVGVWLLRPYWYLFALPAPRPERTPSLRQLRRWQPA